MVKQHNLGVDINEAVETAKIAEPFRSVGTEELGTGQVLPQTVMEKMLANNENSANATTALDYTGKTEEKKDSIQNHMDTDDNTTPDAEGPAKADRYIAKIDPIRKSNRNNELHKIGLCLRGKFGLAGDILEAKLQKVNETKCDTPLAESEVMAICRSVDKSKVVPGQSRKDRNGSKTHTRPFSDRKILRPRRWRR